MPSGDEVVPAEKWRFSAEFRREKEGGRSFEDAWEESKKGNEGEVGGKDKGFQNEEEKDKPKNRTMKQEDSEGSMNRSEA